MNNFNIKLSLSEIILQIFKQLIAIKNNMRVNKYKNNNFNMKILMVNQTY